MLTQTLKNATDHFKDIQSQYDLGASTLLELLSAQQAENLHKINLYNEQLDYDKQLIEIKRLCGLDLEQSVSLLDTIQLDKTLNYNSLWQSTKENNLSIAIANQNKVLSDTDIAMIKADIYPTISLSAGYYNNSRESDSGFIRESSSAGTEVNMAFSWTLFNGGRRLNALKTLKNKQRLIEYQQANTQQLVQSELLRLFKEYETGLSVLELLKSAITTQQQAFDQSQFLFKTGQSNITELQNSKIELLTAQKQYNDKLLSCRVIELRLYQLSGQFFNKNK